MNTTDRADEARVRQGFCRRPPDPGQGSSVKTRGRLLLRHRFATPLPIRATLMGALAYFILPFDATPTSCWGWPPTIRDHDRSLHRRPSAHHRGPSREGARSGSFKAQASLRLDFWRL